MEMGKHGGKVMDLLNKIEAPIIERSKKLGYSSWITADQLLVALFLNE